MSDRILFLATLNVLERARDTMKRHGVGAPIGNGHSCSTCWEVYDYDKGSHKPNCQAVMAVKDIEHMIETIRSRVFDAVPVELSP